MPRRSDLGMDFARQSPRRAITWVLLAAGVIGSVCALWQRHGLLLQRTAAMDRIEARQRSTSHAQSPRPSVTRPEALAEADRVVADLQRPWEPMLDALQAAVRGDVVVLRVQPEADAFKLRIAGQADSHLAFLAFVQRLQDDASWRAVEPLSEAWQPEGVVSGGKPVSFLLTAHWRWP